MKVVSHMGAIMVWMSFLLPSVAAGVLELRKGDVVAFVGGTDLVNIQKEGRLESALTMKWKEHAPLFRDFAWDGDTVYHQSAERERWRQEAFGNWDDQLKRAGATVVIAQFGKMESFDGEGRIDEFVEAYGAFLDRVGKGRRLVLLEPAPMQWKGAAERAALPAYAAAIADLAAERKVPFVSGDGEDMVASFIEQLSGKPEPDGEAYELMCVTVAEKHRLWCEYWRPANWKCIFGDDSRRIFAKAAHGWPSIQEEWASYPELIAEVEKAILAGKPWKAPVAPELTGSGEAGIQKELDSFEVLEGFEVNLFADESHGVRNPLSVRWDASGRMYVACSDVYPQIEAGVRGYDRVIALRDTNHDGKAAAATGFAEDLVIPTGREVGPDRVYIGQGPDLLTLRDTDGDGVSDERVTLLTGFGNGDSHQTSNSFVWSPGGELWWCQGDGIEARVETPFGVSSVFQAGVYRMRPRELRLDPLLDDFMGPGNPWGIAFDDFGQSFVIDGAGGVSFLTPASIPAKRRLRLPRIGNPGGYCGIECLGAGNLPGDMQGQFVIGDYKKNQVSRFETREDGAGFKLEWKSPLLRSKHRNFRPIDVKMGPDGAIYIVDWYNPITCHQDDFYRHPERDKTHGRIWRVTPIRGAVNPPSLVGASLARLLEALRSPERWTRLKAKQVLASRQPEEGGAAVRAWSQAAEGNHEGRDLLEAVSVLEWLGRPDEVVLRLLLSSPDHRARAYGVRVLGRWSQKLENLHDLLVKAARDVHPLVRMEAVLAAGQSPRAEWVLVSAAAAESKRDRWIEYAFSQAVHHSKRYWLPALRTGRLNFSGVRGGLAAVLGASHSRGVVEEIREILDGGTIGKEAWDGLALTLAALGEEEDLRAILNSDQISLALLRAMMERERPGFDVMPPLGRALYHPDIARRIAAVELAAHWKVKELYKAVMKYAEGEGVDPVLREVALRSLGALGERSTVDFLKSQVGGESEVRPSALFSILQLAPEEGTRIAVKLLRELEDRETIMTIFRDFTSREGGPALLAKELEGAAIKDGQAALLRGAWVSTGLVARELEAVLDLLAGAGGVQAYDEGVIRNLVAAAKKGSASRGREVFHSSKASCSACHKADRGGQSVIGPDLSAVGSGLLPDRVVTEVLWPRRQVKEGYALSRIITRDGDVQQGYVQASRDEELLLLRDFASNSLHEIPRGSIMKQEEVGSLMPPTAGELDQQELVDLFAYLFSLDGEE
ncbi:MAG: c-type cytochrome [Roseibacillus sp.]|nr:c-type cytochrome [Roseibacillus sp.]